MESQFCPRFAICSEWPCNSLIVQTQSRGFFPVSEPCFPGFLSDNTDDRIHCNCCLSQGLELNREAGQDTQPGALLSFDFNSPNAPAKELKLVGFKVRFRLIHSRMFLLTVFAKINAHPEISAHQKQWFFKGGSTQNQWVLRDDFSKGGVHKTDGFWWVIFQKGEYTKPMGFDGFGNVFLLVLKFKRPGRLFGQIRYSSQGVGITSLFLILRKSGIIITVHCVPYFVFRAT